MKKLLLFLLPAVLAAQINVQKTNTGTNQLSNGNIVVPSGVSITATGSGQIVATGVSGLSVNTTAPLTGGGALTSSLTLAIPAATGSVNGYLTAADWTTFNSKQPAGSFLTALTGDVTATGPGSAAATVTRINGTSLAALSTGILKNTTSTGVPSIAVAGTDYQAAGNYVTALTGDVTASGPGSAAATLANTAVTAGSYGDTTHVGSFTVDAKGRLTAASSATIPTASTSLTGLLSSTDWNTFNGKQASGNYVTSLTGDVTGSGPGATAATLASTAVTPGSYGDATHVGAFTVDAKGRITAASSVVISGGGGGGVTSLAGTANQIDASASTGAVTLSVPSTFTAPGAVNVTGNLVFPNLSSQITMAAFPAMRVVSNSGVETSWFMFNAGNTSLTGAGNMGFGLNSLANITNQAGFICIGVNTCTGVLGSAQQYTTVVGAHAMQAGSGSNVTSLGAYSGGVNTADLNTFVGYNAGSSTTSGRVTAIGANALSSNVTGTTQAAVGYRALGTATGDNNTALGDSSGYFVGTGASNVYIGGTTYGALNGSNNTVLGANVSGLADNLASNIILATGDGTIRQRFDGTNWTIPSGKVAISNTTDASGTVASLTTAGGVYAAKAAIFGGRITGGEHLLLTGKVFLTAALKAVASYDSATNNLYYGGTAPTTGGNNFAMGDSLPSITSGANNAGFALSLASLTTGSTNVGYGRSSLSSLVSGSNNTAVGGFKTLNAALGDGNVGIGYYAGAYETGSNAFYLDNQDRTNTAGDKAKALLYGTFNATATNQQLTINGLLKLLGGASPVFTTNSTITSGAGSSAGTLTNAPAIGNPTTWIPINDNGTTRYIPAW